MSRKMTRRNLLGSVAAGGAITLAGFPAPAVAQSKPFKLGLLTVKTGPLAAGGVLMEQGVLTYLKEKNFTLGGRKVDFISADTGGNPAGAKTKAQQLIERDQVESSSARSPRSNSMPSTAMSSKRRCRRSVSRRPII